MRANPALLARRLAVLATAGGLAVALIAGGAFLPLSMLHPVAAAAAQDDEDSEEDWDADAEEEESGEEEFEDDGAGEEEADEEEAEEEEAEEEGLEEEGADEEGAEEEGAEEEGAEEEGAEEEGAEEEGAEEEGAEEEGVEEALADDDGAEDDWSDDEYIDQLDAEANNDFEDDSWAGVYEEDSEATEQDDAIPVDDETWGEDVEWEVTEVTEVFESEVEADEGADSVGVGEMLTLRKSSRKPSGGTRSGSRPTAPRSGGRPSGSKDDDEDTPYAYGGRPVSALAVPWQAQIFNPKVQPDPANPRPIWQRSHYCGGALIAPDWVVTAAHCIDQELVDYGFKVRLGVSDIARGDGITYRIERIVRHSQYNAENNDPARPPNMYANDIALIKIAPDGPAKARDPKKIRVIPINRKPLAAGVPVSATGWGAVGTGDTQAASAAILRVDLRLMDTPVCQQRPTYGAQKIHGNVFCASHPTRSTCRGDSGGPVVLTNGTPTLVGLVSWGKKKCAGDGRPGVYTRIDRYAAWIDQAMRVPPARNALP